MDQEKLEELREQKRRELQQRAQNGQDSDSESTEREGMDADAKKNAILRQHLTEAARRRLETVKMTRPERVEKVEAYLVQLAQQDRLTEEVDEEQIKTMLKKINDSESTSFNIRRW